METVVVTFRGKQVLEAVRFGICTLGAEAHKVLVSNVWACGGAVPGSCLVSYMWGRTQDHGG